MHHESVALLTQWKSLFGGSRNGVIGKGPWFRRYLRSCRPVDVPVGSFFYVDKGLILTSLSIVTNNAASLVLAK